MFRKHHLRTGYILKFCQVFCCVDRTETIYVRGVFRIKCAGRNNFNMNHFRSSAISGLFKGFSLPIRTYRSQRSIYRRKAAADCFLLLIRTVFCCWFATSLACTVVKLFRPALLILNTPRIFQEWGCGWNRTKSVRLRVLHGIQIKYVLILCVGGGAARFSFFYGWEEESTLIFHTIMSVRICHWFQYSNLYLL
jgi:hypothetical protein